MLFSIITVTYNAADTIRRTLDSVMSQTCKDYEHIVWDGMSKDNTLRILEECENDHLAIFRGKDSGIYDAMNMAMEEAHGEYLIFLNAGDTFHSTDTLKHISDAIHKNNRPGMVYGQTDIVDINGKYLGPRHLQAPEKLTLDSLRDGMVVCHQSMAVLYRAALFYNLRYKYSSDYEWLIICLQRIKHAIYLPEVITDYLAEGTTTHNHLDSLVERFKIMRIYFGTVHTLLYHVKFAVRYLKRRKNSPNKQ